MSKGKKGPTAKRPQPVDSHSKEEEEKIRQKELAAMIEKYESAVKSGETGADIWSKLGEFYSSAGEYDKAVKCFDKALMLKPEGKQESSILANLASAYAKGGIFEKEVECYNILLKKSPSEPSIWGRAARAYERFGKIQEAVLYYTRAIRMNKDDAALFYDYSFFCEKLGQLGNAVSAAERAAQLKTESKRALERLSILYAKTGDYDGALRSGIKLLQADQGDLSRWEDLAEVAVAGKKYNDAVRILQKGLSKINSPALWYMLGDVYMEQNRETYALYCYSKAAQSGNQAAKDKADALTNKKVIPREVSLYEGAIGGL
ncbi:MAG: tetratricopeptide repeat protein [Promethearchaeati archaeon SRVP18_Atabeyarchaeia-1]